MVEILADKPTLKISKDHIANLKLSTSKLSIKFHFFKEDKFYIIPLEQLNQPSGKIFEYVDNLPELVGEIQPPQKGKKQLWKLLIKTNYYYVKDTYINMLRNECSLTLPVYDEWLTMNDKITLVNNTEIYLAGNKITMIFSSFIDAQKSFEDMVKAYRKMRVIK